MKVIFGIGNPTTPLYATTKHNIGKIFIQNYLIKLYPKAIKNQSTKYTSYQIANDKMLVVSQTYMNISGRAVESFVKKNRQVSFQNMIFAHDDLQHKFTNVRFKMKGSAEGNNGIKSIMEVSRVKDIKRIQFGIGRPQSRDSDVVAKYVLSKFSNDQFKTLQKSFKTAVQMLKKEGFL